MNIQEKLVEEFERIVILREKYRAALRGYFTLGELETVQAQIKTNITVLNELILDSRAALASNDAIEVLTMVERLGKINDSDA